MEAEKTGVVAAQPYEGKILTQEERNDLRKIVLSGQQLTPEQARDVFITLRQNQGAAVITGESTRKKPSKKRDAYPDSMLDADFEKLGI